MLSSRRRAGYAQGLAQIVTEIGDVLRQYFPYDKDNDKNELPDEIVFGR